MAAYIYAFLWHGLGFSGAAPVRNGLWICAVRDHEPAAARTHDCVLFHKALGVVAENNACSSKNQPRAFRCTSLTSVCTAFLSEKENRAERRRYTRMEIEMSPTASKLLQNLAGGLRRGESRPFAAPLRVLSRSVTEVAPDSSVIAPAMATPSVESGTSIPAEAYACFFRAKSAASFSAERSSRLNPRTCVLSTTRAWQGMHRSTLGRAKENAGLGAIRSSSAMNTMTTFLRVERCA
eukprot:1488029-Pleurochrysis_carterae.AAC.6